MISQLVHMMKLLTCSNGSLQPIEIVEPMLEALIFKWVVYKEEITLDDKAILRVHAGVLFTKALVQNRPDVLQLLVELFHGLFTFTPGPCLLLMHDNPVLFGHARDLLPANYMEDKVLPDVLNNKTRCRKIVQALLDHQGCKYSQLHFEKLVYFH